MSDHLSSTTLSALADGELSGDQLALVNQHLADCAECTSSALAQVLLKAATARAGQRYVPPSELRERMVHLASQEVLHLRTLSSGRRTRPFRGFGSFGWAAAVALLLVCVSFFMILRSASAKSGWKSITDFAGLVTEVCDQHIAVLAANALPEVISSDGHTVKPWFQGKAVPSASTFLRASRQIRRWMGRTSYICVVNPRRNCCIALASIVSRCLCNRKPTALMPPVQYVGRTIPDFM